MAHSGDQYYEKITAIQQSMHEREKRRLELERELFAYSRSDKRISQITCYQLHSYLKKICDREAHAKMRNLELLRDVECIEAGMKESCPDHGPVMQQKADFFKKISGFLEENKKIGQELESAKVFHRQHQQLSLSHPTTQPPMGRFLGQQTSRGSDAAAGATSVPSHQPLRHPPNRSMHFLECLPSGLLKDFRVGSEDAAGNRMQLSDDISGSCDPPDCSNLSDKHERTTAMLPSVCASTGAAGNLPLRSDDEQEPSPLVTLARSENNLSPTSVDPIKAEKSPEENTGSSEVAHQPRPMGESGLSHLTPQTTFGKETQDAPGRRESVSTLSSDVQLSESSASYLSLSLTQSELEEDPPDDVASERSAAFGGSGDHNQHSPDSSLHSDGSKHTSPVHGVSSAPAVTSESLSQEGLFYLLDSIEGRLHCEQTRLYEDSSFDGTRLDRIISLCNAGAAVNDEGLEACGAVILRELQRLSLSTAKGCLLPQDVVGAHQSSTDPNEISASLPPDAARLWDRWFKHALLLKERRVLSIDRLVQLFTPLLLERHATYCHQARVLLRTLVSRSSEALPPAEDETDLSSSCGPPPPPPPRPADGDVKPTGPVQKQHMRELQSSEEDSQDESPVESVPIRETRAYQLLKQSAMQERLQSSEEDSGDDGLSGINHSHEEDLGRAKRSSHQDPYPRQENTNSKAHSGRLSKAFWGESDESNSEIEAALRPQPFNTNNNDTDDFWD